MIVNTLENNYRSSLMAFKTNKITPKPTNIHSALYSRVFRESTINTDFGDITEAGRAETWDVYILPKMNI